jgi:serine/threonine protein kinase/tetratricopeptide (TPR) repeat protein
VVERCPGCGHDSSGSSKFCSECGGSLQLGATDPRQPAAPSVPPPSEIPLEDAATEVGDLAELPIESAETMDRALAPKGPATGAAGLLAVGQAFGVRYHIIRLLGAGGMGAVYQAWDAELGVSVALKVVKPLASDDAARAQELERRFKRELLLARQVTHANVVRIHDLGEIDGIRYLTMTYVEGTDLSKLLAKGKLPPAQALSIAKQVAFGLRAAHQVGVVHRDLKPANVMIAGDDALIMDFGIARSMSSDTLGSQAGAPSGALGSRAAAVVDAPGTQAGAIVGTLAYMAPEQARGEQVDHRADLYAFGLILYDMLLGPSRLPRDSSAMSELRKRMEQGVPDIRSVDPEIPKAVGRIVSRCLEKDPAARYQKTAELVAELVRLDENGEPLPLVRRLTPRLMVASAVFVIAMLVGTYFLTRRSLEPPKQHEAVSVLIADFQNGTGDPTFDRTLEPMLKLALEGAGFISAYDRSGISRTLGVRPPEKLDERAALEMAVKQGLGVVLSGSVDRQGDGYGVSVKATHAVTGNVIASAENRASSKDQVLGAATKLASEVREALGDDTSDSDKRFAMETLSATSLEVVRDYAAAAQAMSDSRFEEARQSFSKAVAHDPKFGLAYAGMAIASRNLDKQQDAEQFIKEAVRHVDGMTERERYRTRGLFYMVTGDHQQCVKEFGDLIARYAADASARNNLALCLTYLRNMPRALDEMRQVVKILPKRALYRENLALYADYSGDFQIAEQEVRAMQEPGLFGLLALTFSQLGQGQLPQATETLQALGKIDALGASYAASGLGDLALYEGRLSEAARVFAQGAAADLASKDTDRAANKFAALAYTQLLRRQKGAAIEAAERALTNSKAVKIRFLTARVFVEAGAAAKAHTLAAGLASELQAEPQAYAKIVEGEDALKNGDARQAIKALTEANTLLDTWMGHFDLGRAYLEAGGFTQADSEFDRCLKRRGEALALFLDEEPTYGYFPPVYYYQGRVREGLNSAGFAESYRTYLTIRGQSKEDSLLPEVRRRAGG